MPANLKAPFGESCCDGGECSTSHESAQPCGCDKGANWVCLVHQLEQKAKEIADGLAREAFERGHKQDLERSE